MKYLTIRLSYFKQGFDLSSCFKGRKTNEEALESHAEMLKNAANQLLQIRDIIKGHEVDFYADTHYIGISGEDEVIDKLLEANLAEENFYDDEEDEYDKEYDEDDED